MNFSRFVYEIIIHYFNIFKEKFFLVNTFCATTTRRMRLFLYFLKTTKWRRYISEIDPTKTLKPNHLCMNKCLRCDVNDEEKNLKYIHFLSDMIICSNGRGELTISYILRNMCIFTPQTFRSTGCFPPIGNAIICICIHVKRT